jgi:hypothetical protein
MRADKISLKIREFVCNDNYKSILINGDWGIGKTYEIKTSINTLSNSHKFVKVSLFGIKNVDELMQECIIELIPLINNKYKEQVKENKDWIELFSSLICNSVDKFKNAQLITKIINSRLIFNTLMNTHKRISKEEIIFIFDDLERIQKTLDITEFLGFVEKLLMNYKTKIIIVGNILELDSENKKIFDSFNEKVIDKIYTIDELSNDIKIDDGEFIRKFINNHNLKNLRTIEKCELFYKDVLNKLKNIIKDPVIMNNIKLICFSIVNENVEKTYYKKMNEKERDTSLEDDFYYRVQVRYMQDSLVSDYNYNIIEILYNYYIKETEINIEYINEIYKELTTEKEKHNFYKSQQEIENMININIKSFKSNKLESLENIITRSDMTFIWMKILDKDTEDLSSIVKKKILNFMKSEIDMNDGLYDQKIYKSDFPIQSNILEKLIDEIKIDVDKIYISNIFKDILKLSENLDYTSINKRLEIIKNLTNNPKYSKIILNNMKKINIKQFLPIDSITEEHYRTFLEIYRISERVSFKEIEKIIDIELSNRPQDKIFINRIQNIKKHSN